MHVNGTSVCVLCLCVCMVHVGIFIVWPCRCIDCGCVWFYCLYIYMYGLYVTCFCGWMMRAFVCVCVVHVWWMGI